VRDRVLERRRQQHIVRNIDAEGPVAADRHCKVAPAAIVLPM
jgi:hypothetical protein